MKFIGSPAALNPCTPLGSAGRLVGHPREINARQREPASLSVDLRRRRRRRRQHLLPASLPASQPASQQHITGAWSSPMSQQAYGLCGQAGEASKCAGAWLALCPSRPSGYASGRARYPRELRHSNGDLGRPKSQQTFGPRAQAGEDSPTLSNIYSAAMAAIPEATTEQCPASQCGSQFGGAA